MGLEVLYDNLNGQLGLKHLVQVLIDLQVILDTSQSHLEIKLNQLI